MAKLLDRDLAVLGLWRDSFPAFSAGAVKTYDPTASPTTLPLVLFPRQRELAAWLDDREANREEGVLEKCRQIGATWVLCAWAIWQWLYRAGFKLTFGSRKSMFVDTAGNMDSIFERLRFIVRHLPPPVLPRGFDDDKHLLHMRILNPATGASITGEGGDEMGRGGRSSVYVVDEAAFMEHADKVEAAISQNADCRIYVSTPNGMGNVFARKRFSGAVPVFTYRWQDDPRKTQDWYDRKCRETDPVIRAQEIDLDYSHSVEGTLVPAEWVRAATGLDLPGGWPKTAGLDVAEYGGNQTVMAVARGPVILGLRKWSHVNTNETAWRAIEICRAEGIRTLYYDDGGVGAGVRGVFESVPGPLGFEARGVSFGGSPSQAWHDGKQATAMFQNRRAEMYWAARRRFERTYERETGGVVHSPEDLVSVPDDPQLAVQFSAIRYEHTSTGKIRLESKERMRDRGVKSPDEADAVVLALCGVSGGAMPADAEAVLVKTGQAVDWGERVDWGAEKFRADW